MSELGSRDVIHIGKSDQTPNTLRRNALKIGAGAVVATGVGLVARKLGAKDVGVDLPAPTINGESQRELEQQVPEWFKSGIGRVLITPQKDWSYSELNAVGTTHVYLETDTDLVLVTAEHVGKGYLWKDMILDFPNGKGNNHRRIDARIEAPGGPKHTDSDWWIREITTRSDLEKNIEHPVRAIYIAKPKGYDGRVTPFDYFMKAGSDPVPGEQFIAVGFGGEKGELLYRKVTYKRTTKPEEIRDAGIPLFEFSGKTEQGMSGGAILRPNGDVVALISRGFNTKEKGMTWGIPFAKYQPLTEVFSVLPK